MILQSEKPARLIYILKKFQSGKHFTTDEIHKILENEFGTLSKRTVQRDLQLLKECEPLLEVHKYGKQKQWFLNRKISSHKDIHYFEENELISFHILKAHLKAFNKTVIDDEINRLADKLEEIAPSDIFLKESLFWDKNIGQFDYTQYDVIIRRLIKYISEKKWVKIVYDTSGLGKQKTFNVMFRCMFNYAGSLYCVAYIPDYDDVAIAIQHLVEVEELEDYYHKVPKFDFNKWSKNRFGVFYGKLKKVELKIEKKYNHYFINRRWHSTQKMKYDKQGNMILQMRVPLVPDFISWVMSWGEVITVLKPDELKKEINYKIRNMLKNYE